MPGKSKTLKLSFQDKTQKDVPLTAYAFDRRGNLVSSAKVTDSIDLEKLGGEKVVLGPTLPESGAKPSLHSLRRLRGLEITPATALDTLTISPDLVKHWLLCVCHITGRVVRPVRSGDVTIDYPVCKARVHICEVDRWPWIIYKLSDDAILRMRNDLLGIKPQIEVRIPPVISPIRPKPGPGPDPSPIEEHADMGMPMSMSATLSESSMELGTMSLSKIDASTSLRLAAERMPSNIKAGLTSDALQVVRQTLASSFEFIYPLLCYWPWFWYDCDEIGVVETDHDGRFSLTYLYPCGDQPDLYLWVEYFLGGSWVTVYHPPIRCNTHWNYACGTDITLRVTDGRVPYCDPRPPIVGKKLVVTTIGNNENVATIQRASAGANHGLTAGGAPFGGRIEPHVDFGTGLQHATNAVPPNFFYRWSYRRLGSSATPTIIDEPVYRRYRVDPAVGDPEYRSLYLGPLSSPSGPVFMVPPQDPSDPAGDAHWYVLNARDETATAFFPTHLLSGSDPAAAAGKYEIFLELFDAAGNAITDWITEGIEGYIPTSAIAAPFPPVTIPTQKVTGVPSMSEYDLGPSDGMLSHGMRFVLHIDNNPCTASIDALTGTGLVSDTECGFYIYGPGSTVDIKFIARHPNDFATFDFDIFRGASQPVPSASLSGRVGTTGGGFAYAPGVSRYSKTLSVTTLLTETVPPAPAATCTKAAFAETLYVYAMATDGWSRLSGLDAAGIPKAFALSTS